MCFEILGLDVILDHKLRPYLLEVNHSPSFTTDSPLDKKIKRRVINEALKLMNISEKNKRKYFAKKKQEVIQRSISGKAAKENKQLKQETFLIEQQKRDKWEAKHMGGYTKIYPSENASYYDKFLQAAEDIWQEWTGGKILRAKKEPETKRPSSGLRPIKPVQSTVRKSARPESRTDSTLVSSESAVINKSPPVALTPSVFSRLAQPVKRRIKTEYNPLPPANIYLDQEYCNMYTLPRSSVDDSFTHAISSQRFKTSTDRRRIPQVEIM
jgi:tubulin polyglutamylase TTLL6/13